MNKTQKNSWFSFLNSVVLILYSIYCLKAIRNILSGVSTVHFWEFIVFSVLFVFGFMGVSALIFFRNKQSQTEIESDERDGLIKKRAAIAAFISVWILLVLSYLLLWIMLGLEAFIPIYVLPLIYLEMGVFVLVVYNLAVLVQYGWGGKDGQE